MDCCGGVVKGNVICLQLVLVTGNVCVFIDNAYNYGIHILSLYRIKSQLLPSYQHSSISLKIQGFGITGSTTLQHSNIMLIGLK